MSFTAIFLLIATAACWAGVLKMNADLKGYRQYIREGSATMEFVKVYNSLSRVRFQIGLAGILCFVTFAFA